MDWGKTNLRKELLSLPEGKNNRGREKLSQPFCSLSRREKEGRRLHVAWILDRKTPAFSPQTKEKEKREGLRTLSSSSGKKEREEGRKRNHLFPNPRGGGAPKRTKKFPNEPHKGFLLQKKKKKNGGTVSVI